MTEDCDIAWMRRYRQVRNAEVMQRLKEVIETLEDLDTSPIYVRQIARDQLIAYHDELVNYEWYDGDGATCASFQFMGVEEKSGKGEFELSVDDVKGTVWLSREGWDAMTETWDKAKLAAEAAAWDRGDLKPTDPGWEDV